MQGRAQKFERGGGGGGGGWGGGGAQFPVYTFPLKMSMKTKKKVFTSSDVQFIPQNQVKTKKGQRVLTCSVSTVPLTADVFGGGGARPRPCFMFGLFC